VINFETCHEVRRLSRELNLTPSQIVTETGLNIKTIRNDQATEKYFPSARDSIISSISVSIGIKCLCPAPAGNMGLKPSCQARC
jgi:hypothetical protein